MRRSLVLVGNEAFTTNPQRQRGRMCRRLPFSATPVLADEAVEKLVEHDFIVLELH